MAYKNIPLPTDSKNVSQGDIKENFLQIASFTEKDHVSFDGAVNDIGKHKQVMFTDMTIDATHPPVTTASEIMLYQDNGKLKLRPTGQAAGDQANEFNLMPVTTGHAATGYDILPSGLIINWGTIALGAGSLSGTLNLGQTIGTIYSLTYGVTSPKTNMAEVTNAILFSYSLNAGIVTITRKHAQDTVNFNLLVIGK